MCLFSVLMIETGHIKKKKNAGSLEQNGPRLTVAKKQGPESYNYKELNLAYNRMRVTVGYSLDRADKNPAVLTPDCDFMRT